MTRGRDRPWCIPAVTPARPPSDAVVLFDGRGLDAWQTEKGTKAGWRVEHGYVEVVGGTGDLVSRQKFGDCQLHLEFSSPNPPEGHSLERGNSGVFLAGLYEVQVLDSFDNLTYADGQASAIYGQSPPLVNASRAPGEWQRLRHSLHQSPLQGRQGHDARISHRAAYGVVTQNHTQLLGGTVHRALPLARGARGGSAPETAGPWHAGAIPEHLDPAHKRRSPLNLNRRALSRGCGVQSQGSGPTGRNSRVGSPACRPA